jgi:hypothetical protein
MAVEGLFLLNAYYVLLHMMVTLSSRKGKSSTYMFTSGLNVDEMRYTQGFVFFLFPYEHYMFTHLILLDLIALISHTR